VVAGPEVHEVVVVGAGPAGIRAAVAARAAGAEVLVLDEAPRPGGQIYRQLPPEIRPRRRDPLGASRAKSLALLSDLQRAGASVRAGVEVWGVMPDRVLLAHEHGRAMVLQAGALVLAAGACDRPVAIPGWTLPGVVTAGGVTVLVKAQRVLPGRRVLLAGTGPLLLAAATALAHGGARVVGIAEAAPRRAVLGLLRRPGIVGQALEVAAALWRTPIWARHGLVRIEGTEEVERGIVARLDDAWRPVPGTERALDVDTIVLGYGLVPAPELADLAGCTLAYDAGRGGWIPVSDPERLMATSSPGVFVAGDGAGVAGADVAEAQGRLAGLGAALHVGGLGAAEAHERAAPALRALRAFAAFRRTLETMLAPRPGLYELAADDTIVCRCEEVSAGEIRVAVEEGARQVTEVRAVTRAGMGLCQGRMCVPSVAGLLARWAGVSPETAGRLPPRLPARPVPIPVLTDPVLESVAAPAMEAVRR
jgi:NADPH-dependent 2,4-dienoyl-CoA reductase/sulfur reductase-like enzyme